MFGGGFYPIVYFSFLYQSMLVSDLSTAQENPQSSAFPAEVVTLMPNTPKMY